MMSPNARNFFREETLPWVDSACADCPGFLVLGAAGAPNSQLCQLVLLN